MLARRFAATIAATIALGGVWSPAVASESTVAPAATAPSAAVPVAVRYKNCTALHKKYKHGVGRKGAHDKVTSGKPVTTFYVSTTIYNANKKLDRDHDGVACEKR